MTSDGGDGRLFDAPRVEAAAVVKARVDKTFRAYDPRQVFLLPPSIDDWLPEGHLARFVSELVDEVLDLEPFLAVFTEARGFAPYDPRLMLKLVLYGYTTGVRSSRKIEKCCHDDVAFGFLTANQAPDFRSIARFRPPPPRSSGWVVRRGVGVVPAGRDGQVGPGRVGWVQGAGQRVAPQSDVVQADDRTRSEAAGRGR